MSAVVGAETSGPPNSESGRAPELRRTLCRVDCIHRLIGLLWLLALTIIAGGCAGRDRARPALPQQRVGAAQAELLIEQLKQSSAEIRTLKALIRVTIREGEERSTTLRYALTISDAGEARVEILPLQGAYTLGVVVVGESGGVFLDPAEREALVVADAGKLIRRKLRLPLGARELFAVLAGRMPAATLDSSRLALYRDDSQFAVVEDDFAGYWKLDNGLRVIQQQFRDAQHSKLQLAAEYRWPDTDSKLALPDSVMLELPGEQVQLELQYVLARVNERLDPQRFSTKVPPGYDVKATLE